MFKRLTAAKAVLRLSNAAVPDCPAPAAPLDPLMGEISDTPHHHIRRHFLSIDLPAPISRVFLYVIDKTFAARRALLIVVASLTLSILEAQTSPPPVSGGGPGSPAANREVGREAAQAVAAMSDSIAAQQRSVARQPWPRDTDFAEFHVRIQSMAQEGTAACSPMPSDDITALVETAAASTSVSAELIRSVMRQESAFKPCAVSARCYGFNAVDTRHGRGTGGQGRLRSGTECTGEQNF